MVIARLSPADRTAYCGYLRRTAPLADSDIAALDGELRLRVLPARTTLLRSGEIASAVGVVLTGLVREFYPLADGREATRGFAGPGDYVGSLSDLLSGQPARSTVMAEAPTRLIAISWRRIRELAAKRPAWAEFCARSTERLYLAKAAREYELLALDAEARYVRFRAVYAALEPVIALRHVASYVGVTPEHLSRLRRRLGIAVTNPGARRGSAGPARRTTGRGPRRSSPRSS